jgi:DNA-binding Lrp family transcriptional regulator
MHVFDALDRRLISVLREDGRAPISKLGTILGISRATVQSRLDRLIETGAVLGFTVRFRQDYDVDAIRAIMMIEVSGKSTTAVIRQLREPARVARPAHDQWHLGPHRRDSLRQPHRLRPRAARGAPSMASSTARPASY